MSIRFFTVATTAAIVLMYPITQLKAATIRVQVGDDVKSDRCSFNANAGYWECRIIYNDGESRIYYEKYSKKDRCNKVYYHPPVSERVSGICKDRKPPPLSII